MVHLNKGKINGRSVDEKDGANERAGSEYQIRHIIHYSTASLLVCFNVTSQVGYLWVMNTLSFQYIKVAAI